MANITGGIWEAHQRAQGPRALTPLELYGGDTKLSQTLGVTLHSLALPAGVKPPAADFFGRGSPVDHISQDVQSCANANCQAR
jgi:hypothetical protein